MRNSPRSIHRRLLPLGLLLALTLLAAAGCMPLPDVAQVALETHIPKNPEIDGPAGPLSHHKSRALLEELERRGQLTDDVKRHLAFVQAVSGAPLVAGNAATLLTDGPTTFDAMLKAIEGAKHHVHLETFIFDDDEVGYRFADALIRKRGEGVEVLVLYDSYGCKDTPTAFFDRMRRAGIQVLEFNPLNPFKKLIGWNPNHRDHRKILVVDGMVAFTGGCNITSAYLPGAKPKDSYDETILPWRDLHIRITGPAVAELQKLFLDTWARQEGPELSTEGYFPPLDSTGRLLISVEGSTPGERHRITYIMLISAIGHAQHSIHMTSPYFVPSAELGKTLEAAVIQGVDAKIVLPVKNDSGFALYAGRYDYGWMLRAGVELYEHHGGMVHAKTAVIDGIWSTLGSTNLDLRSFMTNDEVNCAIIGGEFAEAMEAVFAGEMVQSTPIRLKAWEQRPLHERIRETFSYLFRRLL